MTPGAYAFGFVAALAAAFVIVAAAWAASRGRLHRVDRIGAAALAVGFCAAYQLATGGGWHPERPVSWLPLVAVATALVGARLADRVVPRAQVPLAARAFVLAAAGGLAAVMLATGRSEAAALALGTLGATLGSALGERLPDDSGESGASRPDRRPATWVLAALLVGLVPVLAA